MRSSVHNLLIGTALSILVFFAVSFLTVLKSILLPSLNYSVDIGFPSRYYYQFYVNGNGYPLHG